MSTTINKEEIQKFSRLADEWWDVNGKFKPLHMFNPIRIEYISENIKNHFNLRKDNTNFLRLGANVTGIDASQKNINIAKLHSQKNGLQINYINTSPENLNSSEKFDIILNLEIVEHVDNVNLYIKSCARLLKRKGLMFTATLNRSFTSYVKAIIGAEYILRWLPVGTHDWNKFIKPEELEKFLAQENFSTLDITGLKFNPLLSKWKKSNDLSVNYIISSTKN